MSLVKAPEPQGYMVYGPEPKFPDVPYAEWKARIDKVKKLMRENSVDLLMVADDPNCRYFTGITSEHWITRSIQPLLALIPIDADPVIITGDLFRMTMEAQSWARDIRCQEKPHEIEAQRKLWKEVAETIKEIGYGKATIAIENGPMGHVLIPRPLIDIQTFMKELPEARFVDGDKLIWACRMIKSPLEIERLKQASAVQRKGYTQLVEDYRPGMTETDVGKILWHSYLDNGADKLIAGHIACGAEKEGMLDTGFHFEGAEIHRDDYLWLDMAVRYKGYWSDNARVLNVGPTPEWFIKNNEILWKAFDAATEVARPGIPAKEIWKAAVAVEKEAGWPPLEMVGHGIGMDIHEPPALSAEADTILEPGMCFEVEPACLTGFRKFGGQGIFHYENLIIITERGCEVVHGLRRGVIQVNHPYQ